MRRYERGREQVPAAERDGHRPGGAGRIAADEGAGDGEKLQEDKTRLTLLRREYREFCKAAGLRQQSDRVFVAAGAEKAPQSLANSGKSDIIEPNGAGSMGVDIEIDKFTPCLEDAKTGEIVKTTYSFASQEELTGLKKKGWLFNWRHKSLKDSEIYKLTIQGETDIQGLIAFEYNPKNYACHISLAESAPHNKGLQKRYNGVGGHLFAIAAQKSFDSGFGGFLYFEAKNMELVRHYSEEFGAQLWGRPHQYSMIIDTPEAKRLLQIYNSEEVT